MLKKQTSLIQQVALAVVIACILVATDHFFFQFYFGNHYPRPWTAWPETIALLCLLSFGFRRTGFIVICMLLSLMAYIQMAHLRYFGTFIHPTKIYLAFTQYHEIFETVGTLWDLMRIPIFLFFGNVVLIALASQRFKSGFIHWRPLKWILLIALIYAPLRTYFTGNTYGKQPAIQNMAFSNMYASFSYFLGKTLPYKLQHRSVDSYGTDIQIERKNPAVNVILVMGESLRYQNLHLFGYDRPTTPRLDELSKAHPTVLRKGVGGGVCTDVAIPLFMNNVQGPEPMPAVLSQKQCLFSLAKKNGFTTHFYSAQSKNDLKHILNYLCPGAVDRLELGDGQSLTEDKERRYYDDQLLKQLDQIDFNRPNFVLFHQRGSHSPYEFRYPESFARFQATDPSDIRARKVATYDNSVAFTDHVLGELIEGALKRSKLPLYVIFTSDHGQALGENGVWGHVEINEFVYKVPFLFLSSQENDPLWNEINRWPEFVTHQEMGNALIKTLGYERNLKIEGPRKAYVMGYDLDGLAGGAWIDVKGPQVVSSKKAR